MEFSSMRKFTHEELQVRQKAADKDSRLPFCLVANNVRSLYNVGALFRTADGAGLEKIWLCGITGIPPAGMISKTALGAENRVPWEYRRHARDLLEELRGRGYTVVHLEQTHKSIPYQDFRPAAPVCLVVGNEITGVSESLLLPQDTAVEIEMAGLKNSLNVTVAFGIAAYHIRLRLLQNSTEPSS